MSVYVVDSNFFIQAHRGVYPLDVAKSFWGKVQQLASEGTIISIDKVKNEIHQNEDELKIWCDGNLPDSFFHDTTSSIDHYSEVIRWAYGRQSHYLAKALAEFSEASEADAWLIAYAMADSGNRIIVTHEISEPQRRNKIKIPDVCIANNISYTNTIEMFRAIGASF